MAYTPIRDAALTSQTQCTFASNTAGNFIVAFILVVRSSEVGAPPSTITDSAGNVYQLMFNDSNPLSATTYPSFAANNIGAFDTYGYFCPSIVASGSNTLTIPNSVLTNGLPVTVKTSYIEAHEFSSTYSTLTLDPNASGTNWANDWFGGGYFGPPQVANIEQPNEIYFTFCYELNNTAAFLKSTVTQDATTNDIAGNIAVWAEPVTTISIGYTDNPADSPLIVMNGRGIYGTGSSVLPPVVTFTPLGDQICWNISGTYTSASIDNGIGAVSSSGCKTVSPTVETTYTLSVVWSGGTINTSVTAPTTVAWPYTQYTYPSGAPLSNGYVLIWLDTDAKTPTGLICRGMSLRVPLDANGVMNPVPQVWQNVALLPSGCTYLQEAYTPDGELVLGPDSIVI